MTDFDTDKISYIRQRLDRPIVLIGLMGAGKSRIGRMLGHALEMSFVDADDEIECAPALRYRVEYGVDTGDVLDIAWHEQF